MNSANLARMFIVVTAVLLASCGKSSSSSSSSQSAPSGFSSEQRDKYNSLSPEGKEHVRKQMEAYDKATKR